MFLYRKSAAELHVVKTTRLEADRENVYEYINYHRLSEIFYNPIIWKVFYYAFESIINYARDDLIYDNMCTTFGKYLCQHKSCFALLKFVYAEAKHSIPHHSQYRQEA